MHIPVKALCLGGPTGCGKTAAALYLAHHLNGEIINTDSRQVYSDFPIITAQPTAQEKEQHPHHLYGFLETKDKLSAVTYANMVVKVAKDIISRKKTPILVGGTGLYFKALLQGISEIPDIDSQISVELLKQCSEIGSCALYKELNDIDPHYAQKIHPNDKQRIMRALEVYKGTGKTFSWWHEHAKALPLIQGPYFAISMPLNDLRPRLDARIEVMLSSGALDEAKLAYAKYQDSKLPGWSGIGCAELFDFLAKKIHWPDALELWKKNTRSYAKRQLTWFKAVPQIQWFNPHDVELMLQAVYNFNRNSSNS